MLSILNKWAAPSALALAMFAAPHAHAWSFKVLHTFTGTANDGATPGYGNLIADRAGNLYGTTTYGGVYDDGTVFKLAPDGTLTVVHSFSYTCDSSDGGAWPYGGVIRDRAGNLYGTTWSGCYNSFGTVFKLAPDGTETTLHAFSGADGRWPYASLAKDGVGNLYGTASEGGTGNCWDWEDGCGTAFKLAPDGSFTKLHDFSEDDGEAIPLGSLVTDKRGNLYGTTNGTPFAGSVFKLAPNGTETILYAFGGDNGEWPWAGPTRDKGGNLYGATQYGGTNNDGAVFTLASDGTQTVLHSFGGNDGRAPRGGVIRDHAGSLYGTASYGGKGSCNGGVGCGTIFKVKTDGIFKLLHKFDCTEDGCIPLAGLVRDASGNLYGTTSAGGERNDGTVFELLR